MEIRQLKQFVAVAESESFTKGAQRVNLSQPAISATIANLEKELNRKLFVRNKRVVSLTAEGERLLKFAGKMLKEYAELKAAFSKKPDLQPITVFAANTFPLEKVASTLSLLTKAMPITRSRQRKQSCFN